MTQPSPLSYSAVHFKWRVADRIGLLELNRPERKNPLTFDSYAELRDLFRALVYEREVRAVVISGAGGNFCSGGDVHEIIGPLTRMAMPELLDFTRMTGDLVRAFNERGSLMLTAEVDGVVGLGVVRAPAVRWAKRSQGGRSANALTSERLTDLGGGPAFYSCLVEVEKCGD